MVMQAIQERYMYLKEVTVVTGDGMINRCLFVDQEGLYIINDDERHNVIPFVDELYITEQYYQENYAPEDEHNIHLG